jgi:hypothetical protein
MKWNDLEKRKALRRLNTAVKRQKTVQNVFVKQEDRKTEAEGPNRGLVEARILFINKKTDAFLGFQRKFRSFATF